MTKQFEDIFNNPINVGDIVAVAFPAGRSSSVQRIGRVLAYHEKPQAARWDYLTNTYVSQDPVSKIEIEWDRDLSGGYVPDKPTKMELWTDRFIKITK